MSDCKIYPADTVDVYGNVWPTVGENIRNGIFGENVKVGYVNINKGNVTSTDFIISKTYDFIFKIKKANCMLIIPLNITRGGVTFSIFNSSVDVSIQSGTNFNNFDGTFKIIYKDL